MVLRVAVSALVAVVVRGAATVAAPGRGTVTAERMVGVGVTGISASIATLIYTFHITRRLHRIFLDFAYLVF